MDEFKILTFKEISDALNAGKYVEVEGSNFNPFRLIEGKLVDRDESFSSLMSEAILKAMQGRNKARIIDPKVTLWAVVIRIGKNNLGTNVYNSENIAKDDELFRKEQGTWVRTVRVEV